jgi:hypothetical protein
MLCFATIHTWVKISTTQPQVLQAQEDDVIGLGTLDPWGLPLYKLQKIC